MNVPVARALPPAPAPPPAAGSPAPPAPIVVVAPPAPRVAPIAVAAATIVETAMPALPDVGAMSAAELVLDVRHRLARVRHEFHAIGLALAELCRERRYRHELGFASFEEMLDARSLPSRMTALKYVVASRVPASLAVAIGVERSYALARFAEKKGRPLEPLALPGARLFGRPIADLPASAIRAAIRGALPGAIDGAAAKAALDDARAAARDMRSALGKAGVDAKITIDVDDDTGRARVHVELTPAEARELATIARD